MLDLKKTLTCGQCFRWKETEDGSWSGVVNGRIYNLRQDNIRAIEQDDFLSDYFDMARDYDAIDDMLAKDEVMRKAIPFGKGIRILNQDFFETLMSFIVSQNNNIPRIQGCIEKMCELFGEPIGEDVTGKRYYSFPTAERLANLKSEDLAPVRLGYRDKFIIESARQYLEGNITELTDYQGVGPKVASCTEPDAADTLSGVSPFRPSALSRAMFRFSVS